MVHELDKPNSSITALSITQPRQNVEIIVILPRVLCNPRQLLRPCEFRISSATTSITHSYRVPRQNSLSESNKTLK
jgi:hypothetical protein